MSQADFSDETLMRYADGELDEVAARAVERAMDANEALAARAALFIETRLMAQSALKALAAEPVPQELTASVERMIEEARQKKEAAPAVPDANEPAAGESDSVRLLAFPGPRTPRSPAERWRLPIAASLAAVLGGALGYVLSASDARHETGLQIAAVAAPALVEALATTASGGGAVLGESGQRFRAIATFRDASDRLCREFELDTPDNSTVISVACRQDEAWQVNFAVVAPGNNSGFAPASSMEALDAYLTAIEAKPPMPIDEEAKVLADIPR